MTKLSLFTFMLPLWLSGTELPAIKNMHAVNDHIYRGAQPTPEGFKELAKMGIKTVIDLRDNRALAEEEKRLVESLGMRYIGVPMRMQAPSDDQIAKVLAILNSSEAGPLFIHCLGGKDRTGTAIACYRIAHDGWDNKKALSEASVHGLGAVDVGMRHYILRYRPPTHTGSN